MRHFKTLLKIAACSPPGTALLPTSSSSLFLIIATPGEKRDIYRKDRAPLALSLSVFILVAHYTRVHFPPPPTHARPAQLLILFPDKHPFTTASLVFSHEMMHGEPHVTTTEGVMLGNVFKYLNITIGLLFLGVRYER